MERTEVIIIVTMVPNKPDIWDSSGTVCPVNTKYIHRIIYPNANKNSKVKDEK
jgi:hypothetical protein